MRKGMLMAIAIILSMSTVASGVTLLVPSEYPSIQAGINAAVDGDLVSVAPGTYVENIDFVGKAITVRSEAVADVTVIDGNGVDSVVHCISGESEGTTISGFTLQNGDTDWGGGIYCKEASINIEDCNIFDNSATSGGGIYCGYYSTVNITNCFIDGNTVSSVGGGVDCYNYSVVVINNSTISNNTAHGGGGIYINDAASVILSDNEVVRNSVVGVYGVFGGGMKCSYTSPVITNCHFAENSSDDRGAGIYFRNSSPTISHCTVTGNLGTGIETEYSSPVISDTVITHNTKGIYLIYDTPGAIILDCTIFANEKSGIQLGNRPSPTIRNCVISENRWSGISSSGSFPLIENCLILGNTRDGGAGGIDSFMDDFTIRNCMLVNNEGLSGGGISIWYSQAIIENCTIADNIGRVYGGGISADQDSSLSIINSIFWGNEAQFGKQMSLGDTNPSIATVSYSNFQGGEQEVLVEGQSVLNWLEGNIDADPIFVGDGDYHLIASSPCIDAGTDIGVYTDIDGDVRSLGDGFDMGADEHTGECWDSDRDRHEDEVCGGDDCDDTDSSVYPGAPEICEDGLDNDCDALVDYEDPDCFEFTLELDASYETGMLNLNFNLSTAGPTVWDTFLILTRPTIRVVHLWTVPLPVIYPPVEIPVSFAFPSLGWVMVYTEFLTAEGLQADEFAWVYTD